MVTQQSRRPGNHTQTPQQEGGEPQDKLYIPTAHTVASRRREEGRLPHQRTLSSAAPAHNLHTTRGQQQPSKAQEIHRPTRKTSAPPTHNPDKHYRLRNEQTDKGRKITRPTHDRRELQIATPTAERTNTPQQAERRFPTEHDPPTPTSRGRLATRTDPTKQRAAKKVEPHGDTQAKSTP